MRFNDLTLGCSYVSSFKSKEAKMKKTLLLVLTAMLIAGFAFCKKKQAEEVGAPRPEPGEFGITRTVWDTTVTPQDRVKVALAVKKVNIELLGDEAATFETSKGTFFVELYSNDAPNTVRNFVRLSESGFYDGLIFFRYDPGFVIQSGSPYNRMQGNAGYNIAFEVNERKHELGAMGMARGQDRNSAGCQFYFCLAPQPALDGGYVVFGKVIEGINVMNEIRIGDTIRKITVTRDVPEEPSAGE
jgi:peptidyl-prolyl cis-trans isomerase B (cyclophilin B)